MTVAPRYRVAVIAGGLIAQGAHLRAYREIPGVEIEALLAVLERGGTHPLDGHSARAGHEIMMAIYESARRRARVDLPLRTAESPLEAMLASGELP